MVILHKLTETQLLSLFVFLKARALQMAKKGGTGGIICFLTKPVMVEPLEANYMGKFFNVPGTFWPGGSPTAMSMWCA